MNQLMRLLCVIGLLFSPQLALAHMPISGIGNFYNGFLHPVFVPAHLLLLISFALLVGQRGIVNSSRALIAYAVGTLLGLALAWFSSGGDKELYILTASTFIGLLVASNLPIKANIMIVIAVLVGFTLGIDSAQETLTGKDKMASLFGSGVAIYFLLLHPMALAEYLQKKVWGKIGVRVVASWVVASSVLVLALSLKNFNLI